MCTYTVSGDKIGRMCCRVVRGPGWGGGHSGVEEEEEVRVGGGGEGSHVDPWSGVTDSPASW